MERKQGKLWFMCANARAGKSTYADSWLRSPRVAKWDMDDKPQVFPRVVVSGDAIRKAIHGHSFLPEAESLVHAFMEISIRMFYEQGYEVLVDETSTSERSISMYLKICEDAQPIFIDTPIEVCKERAVKSGKEYLLDAIDRIGSQFIELKKNWPEVRERVLKYVRMRREQDKSV